MVGQTSPLFRCMALVFILIALLAVSNAAYGQWDSGKAYHVAYEVPTVPYEICRKSVAYYTTPQIGRCFKTSTNSSERSVCDVHAGLKKMIYYNSDDCWRTPDVIEYSSTRQCYYNSEEATNLARVIHCGSEQWRSFNQLDSLVFVQGEGNVTLATGPCTEGVDCSGPRKLEFSSPDCTGAPIAHPVFSSKTPLKHGMCYSDGKMVNFKVTCDAGQSMRFLYNNGCNTSPFKVFTHQTDTCFKTDTGTSFKYAC